VVGYAMNPDFTINIVSVSVSLPGSGFVDTTTILGSDFGGGTGFRCRINSLVSGNNNIAIGINAGNNATVSSNNIFIGRNTNQYTGTPYGNNNIVIGNDVQVYDSNQVIIGNSNTTNSYIAGYVYLRQLEVGIAGIYSYSIRGGSGSFTSLGTDSLSVSNKVTISGDGWSGRIWYPCDN
jgi:hypothetical protein